MSTSAEDDRIGRAARGDRAAASSLAAELLPRVRNLVRYLVRGDTEVDDMAQEALIAILKGLPTYRGEGSFKSWSDRIVARTTFAYLKRKRADASEAVEAAAELEPPAAPGRGDDYVARRQLARVLDRLPTEQRHAIVLHHCMGLSVPEIAEALGVPFDTAKSRIRLGMASLRTKLEET